MSNFCQALHSGAAEDCAGRCRGEAVTDCAGACGGGAALGCDGQCADQPALQDGAGGAWLMVPATSSTPAARYGPSCLELNGTL